jgi:hypothetical protein
LTQKLNVSSGSNATEAGLSTSSRSGELEKARPKSSLLKSLISDSPSIAEFRQVNDEVIWAAELCTALANISDSDREQSIKDRIRVAWRGWIKTTLCRLGRMVRRQIIRDLSWASADALLRIECGRLRQHLAQLGFGLRRFALGRLPLPLGQYLGMPEARTARHVGFFVRLTVSSRTLRYVRAKRRHSCSSLI